MFQTGVPRRVAEVHTEPAFARRFDEASEFSTQSVLAVPLPSGAMPGLGGRPPLPDSDGGREAPLPRLQQFEGTVRIDTPQEWLYFRHGGILQYVLRQLLHRNGG